MVAIYIESNLMVKAIVANYFLNYNSATQLFFILRNTEKIYDCSIIFFIFNLFIFNYII